MSRTKDSLRHARDSGGNSVVSDVPSEDPFASFDWQRTGSDGSRGSGRGGGVYSSDDHNFEQVDYEPSVNRSHSVQINTCSDDTEFSAQKKRLSEKHRAASLEGSLEDSGYPRKSFLPVGITVEDHSTNDGASAMSRSPGRHKSSLVDSPRFSPRFR